MDLAIKNKLALVTGSTAGIGFAIAKALAQEGCKVIINGRTEQRVQTAINQMKSLIPDAQLIPAVFDLIHADAVTQLTSQFDDLDILVNNLGLYEIKPFSEITDEEWLHMFNVNVMSGVRLSRFYFPRMLSKNNGRIIFISSESGVQIPTEMIHYGMTKAAQIAISRGLAELTTKSNVTVNSILVGPTRTEGVDAFIKNMAKEKNTDQLQVENEFFATIRPTSVIKRFIEPDEIGTTVAYLASPLAAAINGSAIRAEGGLLKAMV